MLMAGYWDVNFLFFNYCLLREGYARAALPLLFCPSPPPSKGKKTKLNELDKSLYLL
ncbi:hypothetical protein OIU77_026229 [Salix suchowensis]|uniref:Uncharacterized protein n=1 Tax=Salix suchowensis TaxID=1278906 RepID=A0ABQ9BYZ5_9ROSI|nr:hypothetical protein OIU77_026229 [Salix suchowensis]